MRPPRAFAASHDMTRHLCTLGCLCLELLFNITVTKRLESRQIACLTPTALVITDTTSTPQIAHVKRTINYMFFMVKFLAVAKTPAVTIKPSGTNLTPQCKFSIFLQSVIFYVVVYGRCMTTT